MKEIKEYSFPNPRDPFTVEDLGIPKLETLSIQQLAGIIYRDWHKPYFGASPYIKAMFQLESINDNYGADDGRSIVNYFLSNASSWRGVVARAVKAELNRRLRY